MIKKQFTDGLFQIAIVLSLLRTDINNLINSLHQNHHPEIHEIILGSSSAFTQTNFHHSSWNNDIGSVHPKSLDSIFADSVFRDLHSLSHYRRFDGLNTSVNAWLINAGQSDLLLPGESATNNDNNNNQEESESPADNQNDNSQQDGSPQSQETSQSLEPEGAFEVYHNEELPTPPATPTLSGELTKEDMDLIEVLWRQDMDLGVGREMFDLKLRQELEKERELELQKQREEERTFEKLQEQQQQNISYIIDGETGEMVPAPPGVEGQNTIDHNLQNLDTQLDDNDGLSIDEAMRLLEQQTQVSAPFHLHNNGTLDLADVQGELEAMIQNVQQMAAQVTPPTTPTHTQFTTPQQFEPQPTAQVAGVQRQDSFEQALQEVANLFPISNQVDTSQMQNMAPVNVITPENSIGSMMNMAPGNSSMGPIMGMLMDNTTDTPLIQNTTMTPAINPADFNNGFSVPTLTDMAPPMDFPMIPAADNANLTTLFPNASMIPGSTSPSALFNMDAPNFMMNNMTAPVNQAPADATYTSTQNLLQQLMDDSIDMTFDDTDLTPSLPSATRTVIDDVSSDSAVSSMGTPSMGSTSPMQDLNDTHSNYSEFDGLEGAIGGSDLENNTSSTKFSKVKYETFAPGFGYGDFNFGGNNMNLNHSGSSNGSDGDYKPADMRHVKHNHTYPLQPGQQPKEKKTKLKEDKRYAGLSRDAKKAKQMKIPFSTTDIIHAPVDQFNEMLQKYQLTESQLTLIRDIRRRGKNKVAAQNCRKRKMEVVDTLEEEIIKMKAEKDRLLKERSMIDKDVAEFRHKMSTMYKEVFASLRDDDGNPYDPNEYSLQQTADGNVFLVPRNSTNTEKKAESKPQTSRKRKGKKSH